jgi:hypothetical protein
MALIMRLENQAGTTLYDFLADPNLRIETETHRRSPSRGGGWQESGIFIRKGTPQSIRLAVTKLEDIFRQAVEWDEDQIRNQSIWFVWATDTESLKRSLLIGGLLVPQTSKFFDANLENSGSDKGGEFGFTIEHQGFEDYAASTATGTVHAGGGKLTLSEIHGTKPGRIASAVVELPDIYDTVWMGIRPVRDSGSISSFNPILQAESATTVESGDGALADSNTVRRFDFGNTTSMIPRIQWQLTDMDAYQGSYHALLVARIATPVQSFALRLRSSLAPIVPPTAANSYNAVSVTEEVYLPLPEVLALVGDVPQTKRQVVDLGVIRIPFMGYRQQIRDAGNIRPYIALEFQKLAGPDGSFLDIDKIILVPAEHFVHVRRWAYNFDSDIHILTHENGTYDHLYIDRSSGNTQDAGLPAVTSWQYPREGGVLVCVCGSSLNDDADATEDAVVTLKTHARWDNYRENY